MDRIGGRISVWLLVAAGLFLVVFLAVAEKPWSIAGEIAEREAEGKLLILRHHVTVGLYWAAGINLALLAGVLLCWRLWAAELEPLNSGLSWFEPEPRRWLFYVLIALIAVGGIFLRSRLAQGSLWWDELWTVKQTVVGGYVETKGEDGQEAMEFRAVDWERAAWYYRKPTNHPVASLSSRLSYLSLASAEEFATGTFREWVIRLPMLLCSGLAIAMAGLVARRWGGHYAGILAALLLALHPWHIRYGIDARAYSFLVLWAFTGCWWLGRLFGNGGGGWISWWGFGLNQLLIVWTFPQAVFLAGGFAAAALGLVFWSWQDFEDRRTAVSRLVVVNLVAAMAFLMLFAPNLHQMREWLADDLQSQGHQLNGERFGVFASQLGFGLPPRWAESVEAEGLPTLASQLARYPVMGWLLMVLTVVAVLFGMLRLSWRDPRLLAIPGAIFLGLGASLFFFWATGGYFYPRFLVFALAPLVLLLAIGLDGLGRVSLPSPWLRLPGMLYLVLFIVFVFGQIGVLRSRDYSPLRRVAAVFRGAEENTLAVGYGHGVEVLPVYFPSMRFIVDRAGLKEAQAEAEASSKRLLVAYGHRTFNQAIVPDGFELLDDPEQYAEVIHFSGIEPQFYFRVLEWRPGIPLRPLPKP